MRGDERSAARRQNRPFRFSHDNIEEVDSSPFARFQQHSISVGSPAQGQG